MKGNTEEKPQVLKRFSVSLERTVKRGERSEKKSRNPIVLSYGDVKRGQTINVGHTKNWEVTKVELCPNQKIQVGDYPI